MFCHFGVRQVNLSLKNSESLMKLNLPTQRWLPLLALLLALSLIWPLPRQLQAQTGCTRFIQSQPNAALTNQLAAALTTAGITTNAVSVSTHGEVCFNEQTKQVETFDEISTDFDVTLPVESLTDVTALGNLTARLLPLFDKFPPAQTPGAKPGRILISYAVGEASNYIELSVTQASNAVTQKLSGESLMTTLGYQAAEGPTVLQLQPVTLKMTTCDNTAQSRLTISNVSDMQAFELELTFDPNVVLVVDANPNSDGVQIKERHAFGFVVINQVDNQAGRIQFGAALSDISGTLDLLEINWQLQQAGQSELRFKKSALVNKKEQAISHVTQNGQLELSSACNKVSGRVTLQGRSNHQGVLITDALGQQTQTDLTGGFSFFGGASLVAKKAGYLTAMAEIKAGDNQNSPVNVGRITLLAGDVTGDNVINIFDLSYMANRFNSDDTSADLNADGVVNIFDMVLASGNWQKQGPLTNWE